MDDAILCGVKDFGLSFHHALAPRVKDQPANQSGQTNDDPAKWFADFPQRNERQKQNDVETGDRNLNGGEDQLKTDADELENWIQVGGTLIVEEEDDLLRSARAFKYPVISMIISLMAER